MVVPSKAVHFRSAKALEKWLERNAETAPELLIAFFNKSSGRTGMSYREALDLALCFGWIDGVRRRIDQERYSIRFSPRKPRSIWSLINTRRARELKAQGLMRPQGLKAFAARKPSRTGVYSFENAPRALSSEFEARFRQNAQAWKFFESRPPWYRRVAIFWVMNVKKPETRERRLQTLILDSEQGRSIRLLTRR